MNLAEASFAVLQELKRLRRDGLKEVYLEEESILLLEKALNDEVPKDLISLPISTDRLEVVEESPKSEIPIQAESDSSPAATIKVYGEKKLPKENSEFQSVPNIVLPQGDKHDQWNWLGKEIQNCSAVKNELNAEGIIHYGRGNLDAEIFFCGDSPSEEDDEAGCVFGGEAGKLLVKIIETMGFSEESVYFSNILHWRPKHEFAFGHRPPSETEMKFSFPYVRAQIDIIKPKAIVLLGKTAIDGFLGVDPKRRLGDIRGTWSEFSGIPLMYTYHPSYLLHNPSKSGKRKVWEDMLKVMQKVGAPISEKQKAFFL